VIAPDASAQAGHELARSTDSLRVPVVDHDGKLLGVLAVTDDLAAFCGAG
jgi:Mg/Co/Ni transporter MgtE